MQNYLVGRIRSKEKELLSSELWSRLAEPAELSDWLGKFKDTIYASVVNTRTFEEFEQVLHDKFAETKKDLFQTKEDYDALLWRKYDIHNLKILLKAKFSGRELNKYLLPFGLTELEKLPQTRLYWEAHDIYDQTRDFSKMSEYLDKTYLQEMLEISKKFGSQVQSFFREVVKAVEKKKTCQNVDLAVQEKILEDSISYKLNIAKYLNISILPALYFVRAKELEIKNLKILFLRQAKKLPELINYLRYVYV